MMTWHSTRLLDAKECSYVLKVLKKQKVLNMRIRIYYPDDTHDDQVFYYYDKPIFYD